MLRVTLTLEGNDQAVSRLMDSLVSSANTWYDLDMKQSVEIWSDDGWDLIREYADWVDYKKENELSHHAHEGIANVSSYEDPRETRSFQKTAVFATTGEAGEPTEEAVFGTPPDGVTPKDIVLDRNEDLRDNAPEIDPLTGDLEDLPNEPPRSRQGLISSTITGGVSTAPFPTFTWEQTDPFVDRHADALERIATALEDIADYLYDDGIVDEEDASYN
jgi:hypothetical protein